MRWVGHVARIGTLLLEKSQVSHKGIRKGAKWEPCPVVMTLSFRITFWLEWRRS
jgi:hypothetical protein